MQRQLLSVVLCCLTISINSFALPSDKGKPLTFRADEVSLSGQSHLGNLSGHVEIEQGTTRLKADKVEIRTNDKQKLTLVKAFGNKRHQAYFISVLEAGKPAIEAYADLITYDPDNDLVFLKGHAIVKQNGSSFSAPSIRFDIKKQHVSTDSSTKGRTQITISEKHDMTLS